MRVRFPVGSRRTPAVAGVILGVLALPACLGAAPEFGAASVFEAVPVFRAADILSPELLAGPHHRVGDEVRNDGYMNHYTVTSAYGPVGARSTAELRVRIRELEAISAMDAVIQTDEFSQGLADGGADLVAGAKRLVTDPKETLSGAASGVGAIFRRAGDSLFGDPASQAEDGRTKAIIGFSRRKGEVASEFGVDVYSSNKILQERLDEIAWASYAGGLSFSALKLLIPGGIGVAVAVSENIDLMNNALQQMPPSDLRRRNREALARIGVALPVIDLFMSNTVYSPTRQTLFVQAVEQLDGVADRQHLVRLGVLAPTEEETLFRQRQAQMYVGLHRSVEPIERFVPVGGVSAARLKSGTVVFVAPVDYLVWTPDIARFVTGVLDQSGTGGQVWLGGGASPLTRKTLESLGWSVHENAEKTLLPAPTDRR